MEENAEWRTAGVYHAGQSPRRRTEATQPRLLETQANQLGKEAHTEPVHMWTPPPTSPLLFMLLRIFISAPTEWVMVLGPHLREKTRPHTRTHTLFNLALFFHAVDFFFPYPPGLSGKLGMQTRRKKQPVGPADILVQHIQTWQGALQISKLLGDILYRRTHLHLPHQRPDSSSKIWKPHQSKLQQSQFFCSGLTKRQSLLNMS